MSLRRFLEPAPAARRDAAESCEFCAAPIPPDHGHAADLANRNILCVCRACYLLFTHEGAANGKYRAIPDRYRFAPEIRIAPEQWDQMQIPVGLAFFFFNSQLGRTMAFYPSPAGATESLLPMDAWQELTDANPLLATLTPDVEALLVRSEGGEMECYIVPIDACYELIGRFRRTWKGFSGGEEARQEIAAFFERIRARSEMACPA